MHNRLLYSLAAVGILVTGASRAAADYPAHEVWMGFGGASSSEKTVFNVPGDIESKPEVAISLGYILNLDATRGVGFHIFGTAETTPDLLLSGPSGSTVVKLDLNTFNAGVRYRHTFARGGFTPYGFIGAGIASGSVQSAATGELTYTGFSAVVGPGAAVPLGRLFMLSAELFGSFGSASWKTAPFANSSGKEFDPSLLGGTLNLSFVWNRRE